MRAVISGSKKEVAKRREFMVKMGGWRGDWMLVTGVVLQYIRASSKRSH